MKAETLRYENLEEGKVRCGICPHRCVIPPGKHGVCRTRFNDNGCLYSMAYGEITSIALDPIEKKPLYHFFPGESTLSISTFGCSFRCPWCQNYSISQAGAGDVPTTSFEPKDVVERAKRQGSRIISYTYNEPLIWFEFVLDTSKLARRENMCNVLVTNGYVTLEALDELLPHLDAANIDVKSINPHFYTKYCAGRLDPVLEISKEMVEHGIHVETTNLIIPGLNDRSRDIEGLCDWHLRDLGPATPLHFSRFFPTYNMSHLPPTPVETVEKAVQTAKDKGIHYTYGGNIPGSRSDNTYCPKCGRPVVERLGYSISRWNVDSGMRCARCGERIAIVAGGRRGSGGEDR